MSSTVNGTEPTLKIALGSDHAGFALKETLKVRLSAAGYGVVDLGCTSEQPVDYLPVTLSAAQALVSGQCARSILVCGNGYAMAMLANRVPGIRAAVCHDAFTARTCRTMGNANLISLGARVLGDELAWDLVQIWLASEFAEQEPRYVRRLAQVEEFERRIVAPDWSATLERVVVESRVPQDRKGRQA
jgi:ribose 5-phosphate isomerase B